MPNAKVIYLPRTLLPSSTMVRTLDYRTVTALSARPPAQAPEFEAALSTSRKKLAGRDATLAQATLAVTEAENALHAKQAQIEILIAESDGLTRQRATMC